jgi:hypothetical protein
VTKGHLWPESQKDAAWTTDQQAWNCALQALPPNTDHKFNVKQHVTNPTCWVFNATAAA